MKDTYNYLKNGSKKIIKIPSLATMFQEHNRYIKFEIVGDDSLFEGNPLFFVRKNNVNEAFFSDKIPEETIPICKLDLSVGVEKAEITFEGCLYTIIKTDSDSKIYLNSNFFRYFKNISDNIVYKSDHDLALFYEGDLLVGGFTKINITGEPEKDMPFKKYLEFEKQEKQEKTFIMAEFKEYLKNNLIKNIKANLGEKIFLLKNKNNYKIEYNSISLLCNGTWITLVTSKDIKNEAAKINDITKEIVNEIVGFKKLFKFIIECLME